MGIPFIIENENGFENWLDEDEIKSWQNKKYPTNFDDFPKFHFSKQTYNLTNFSVNGMILDVVDSYFLEDQPFETIPGRRGITIDTKNSLNSAVYNTIFQDDNYICGNNPDLKEKTITASGESTIEVPTKNNDSIILKPMSDINSNTDDNEILCSIYKETLKKAKPIQVNIIIQ
ncbi:hypothetical protein PIROE2DRAFT_57496 [Piromyces sp. E2]|nr:hypothetical protein PIROE2DRAFT_57496 [Piromyces sp. E2]|eukprot:OUM69277.1 hypothetical protein PIROE2DRAFT_57496 [Piromyces sp. E2]